MVDVLSFAGLLSDLPRERTRLLDNLGRIRREVGPITPELSDAVADHMNIRRGEVHEVVSFYSFLQVPIETPPNAENRHYHETKRDKLGHKLHHQDLRFDS